MKYNTAGTYEIEYKAVDECGNEKTATRSVTVKEVEPAGTITIDYEGAQGQKYSEQYSCNNEDDFPTPRGLWQGATEDAWYYVNDDDIITIDPSVPDTTIQSKLPCNGEYTLIATYAQQKRTVLYNDGTLIINELAEHRNENTIAHEGERQVYPPLIDPEWDYIWNDWFSVYWYGNSKDIKRIEFDESIRPTSTANWFAFCSNLTTIAFEGLDTSNTTSMANMFNGCSSITDLDLTSFDTGSVTNMKNMFYDCENLEILDLSSFATGSLTNIESMFFHCDNLTTIKADSTFVIDGVTETVHVFDGCISLVGGNGTVYNRLNALQDMATCDCPDHPGYFTCEYCL